MQGRVCKFLRHPREAYAVPFHDHPHEPRETRVDETTIDLCIYPAVKLGVMPEAVARKIGGGVDLRDHDCDRCGCFEPVEVPNWK
jgi:hypothetical protein